MRATGCQCLAPNGCHTIFLRYTHCKTKETGARAPLGANVWYPMGVTPSFFGRTFFFGNPQVHARHWVPMSGTQWVFWDTHILKHRKQEDARHWVPMSGTQWVSHPVFFDAPFSWGQTGACAPLGANVWVEHVCIPKKGATPI